MKKRRRLANKMTIMVCAVLIAVSTFFYVPIESFASGTISISETFSTSSGYYQTFNTETPSFNLRIGSNYYDADTVYKVKVSISTNVNPSVTGTGAYLRSYNLVFQGYSLIHADAVPLNSSLSTSVTRTYYMLGQDLNYDYSGYHRGVITSSSPIDFSVEVSHSINVTSITAVTGDSAEKYQEGYDDGYLDGEKYGFDLGYEQGYADGVASVDTGDNGDYDQGYADGVASVDTQSYYNSGYEKGYNDAYDDGYND